MWYHNCICGAFLDIYDCMGANCQNGGSCVDMVNNYRCDCVIGFSGAECEISKNNNLSYNMNFKTLPNSPYHFDSFKNWICYIALGI